MARERESLSERVSAAWLRRKQDPATVRGVLDWYSQGNGPDSCSRKYGVPLTTVRAWIRDAKAHVRDLESRDPGNNTSPAVARERVELLSARLRAAAEDGRDADVARLSREIGEILGDRAPDRVEQISIHQVLMAQPLDAIQAELARRREAAAQHVAGGNDEKETRALASKNTRAHETPGGPPRQGGDVGTAPHSNPELPGE